MAIRTRFAPSPTGFLHIGGARTALFNWLYARHNSGTFVLRIEDTDAERSTDESVQAILDGMTWLGLDWDEGPFHQSQFVDLHQSHAETLLKKGLAYRCWCTPEELKTRREAALKKGRPPAYDRKCRERTDAPDAPFALRFRVPEGSTVINDLVKGPVEFDNSTIEDLVIQRSDGTPTYNFCVVIDDATMEISHVIRGDDHMNNTPKQILIYKALGYPVPEFAHLPMILGADKTRLSKRHGATSVTAYKELGFLPHALVNYLARLGWSHGDQEIFSVDELIEKFTLDSVGSSSGIFNPEKLLWLNHHYLKESDPGVLAPLLVPLLEELGATEVAKDKRLPAIIATLRERSKTLKEMAEGGLFYFTEKVEYVPKASKKFLTPDRAPIFSMLISVLSKLEAFTEEELEGAFNRILEAEEIKLGRLAQPVRVALTGGTISPGIYETMAAMGRERTLARLQDALAFIEGNAQDSDG